MKLLLDTPLDYYADYAGETLREKYNWLLANHTSDRYCLKKSTRVCAPCGNMEVKLLLNREVNKWLTWVNTNIVLRLGVDTQSTTFVKVRIASSMLNKLEANKHLSNLENNLLHLMLVTNIKEAISEMMEEELPF